MKSYVSLEQHLCPVCAEHHDTGALLMDQRLRPTFEMHTVTGMSLCPACVALAVHSVALIEVDEKKSQEDGGSGRMKPANAYRTGNVAWMKREAFARVFNAPQDEPIMFIEQAAFAMLQSIAMGPVEGHA
jgi:hypothetical protein